MFSNIIFGGSMRRTKGGIIHMASVIEGDLEDRETGLTKPQRIGLADLAASVLGTRSVNTSELANVLPRDVKGNETRYRYINRWLSNNKINVSKVISGFLPDILTAMYSNNQTAVFIMDQTKISDGFECLMVSLRVGERALPVYWRVIETKGPIGVKIQLQALSIVLTMIPQGMQVLLTADRFYASHALIQFCQKEGWKYRIRLRNNFVLQHEGGEIRTGDILSLGLEGVEQAELSTSGIFTSIGVLHENGCEEPWIIAMDCKPTRGNIMDYDMRWGIEPMFSDFKSRGFQITKTQLKNADRIERLILVLAVAYYWAVSTGMLDNNEPKQPSKKKLPDL